MPIISPTIVPGKVLRDGRHKVRISICHNGTTRYIVTDIILDSPDQLKRGQIRGHMDSSRYNLKLRKQIQAIEDAVDKIPGVGSLSCKELIDVLKYVTNNTECHSLQSVFDEAIARSKGGESTKALYRYWWDLVCRHINPAIDISTLTPAMVATMCDKLHETGLSTTTINNILTVIRLIVAQARLFGYNLYKVDPMRGARHNKTNVRNSWITLEQLRGLRDFPDDLLSKPQRRWRDLFMLSFYLGGINPIDLCEIAFTPDCDTLRYIRHKTRRMGDNVAVEIPILPQARAIIDKHIGYNGRAKAHSNYTMLHGGNCIPMREVFGIDNLVFYSARKTFSQIAFRLGISESVIDYILGHSQRQRGRSSCLRAYLRVTPAMAARALRQVVDFVESDAKFEE